MQISPLNYIQYSRKSSEAKERQALSINDQNLECERYAHQFGLNIAIKLEESKSSFKPDIRTEFNKMIELIQLRQVNAILTWKPDRLARNPKEGGILMQLLQDGLLQEIRTATGDVYTQNSDHLILQIHFGMANQYSRNLSQNVKRALSHKCERGEYPRPAIVGFETFGIRGSKNIKPHEFEAPLVKEIFDLAKTRLYSLGYLTEYIYNKGLRTKKGNKISKSHLYSILTCPTYYGYFYRNGELYKGNYEPIVNKKLFDQVQEALKDRSKPKVNTWVYPYKGLLRCGECGCTIKVTVKEKFYPRTKRTAQYKYYQCTHRRGNCHQPALNPDELNTLLSEGISKIYIDKKVWELGIKLLREKHKDETIKNTQQLTNLQKQYQTLREKLNNLIDMRANGELDKDEFLAQKEVVLKEQARINALIADNEDSAKSWVEQTEYFLDTAYYARKIMAKGKEEEKEDLIKTVGENLLLKDKKIEITFKKPYDILLQTAYRTNGLPDQDSNLEPTA